MLKGRCGPGPSQMCCLSGAAMKEERDDAPPQLPPPVSAPPTKQYHAQGAAFFLLHISRASKLAIPSVSSLQSQLPQPSWSRLCLSAKPCRPSRDLRGSYHSSIRLSEFTRTRLQTLRQVCGAT